MSTLNARVRLDGCPEARPLSSNRRPAAQRPPVRMPCPKCGGEMRITAFIKKAMVVREILAYLGEPDIAPRMAPARCSPLWEMLDAAPTECDPQAQPAPDYEFDQRIAW